MKHFNDKTAFITGGAAGIGLGMAKAFAGAGMNLVLADLDTDALAQAARFFDGSGTPVLTIPLDVCDREALAGARRASLERFGAVHLLCANAGVGGYMGPLQEGSLADWDWALDVNLKGSINTIHTFLPELMSHGDGAHIVITSSISGLRVHRPSRGQGMYNTSKFALVGLGEALSLDLEPVGVGVSILCPGVVNTAITDSGRHRPARYGGAFEREQEHELALAALQGTEPELYGTWVLEAVKRRQLHVITHTDGRAQVEERHRRILRAFDEAPVLTGEAPESKAG